MDDDYNYGLIKKVLIKPTRNEGREIIYVFIFAIGWTKLILWSIAEEENIYFRKRKLQK